jgi:hypothetical protein
LNRDPNWRQILGKKHPDKHQKDVELILRVFALCDGAKYEKPMKEFLNITMRANQDGAGKRVSAFVKKFPRATELIFEALGTKPFHLRGPLNSSVLDSVMATVIDNVDALKVDQLSRAYDRLVENKAFSSATSYDTSDAVVVATRFREARRLIAR